ncbi:MAG: hypothetical protein ACK5CE_15025 [Actinomycetes bacterium]|jgi:hypothetical protein|uniref:Unannotated protein n=1 Tax=freshwater metagenome TaxID=449393 RepID=A0A6J6CRP1_9ZZZZ
MVRWVRRLVTCVSVCAAVAILAAVARWWTARSVPAPSATPQWPPFDPAPAVTDPAAPAATTDPVTPEPVRPPWVAPVDGQCTIDHPVKANDNSGIYHVPGGRFYDRTRAERCYVDAVSAEADGYRAAKA